MLTVIGLGWVVATSVTVLGMFMTACRRRGKVRLSCGKLDTHGKVIVVLEKYEIIIRKVR